MFWFLVVGADAEQSLIKNHKYFRQDNYKTIIFTSSQVKPL